MTADFSSNDVRHRVIVFLAVIFTLLFHALLLGYLQIPWESGVGTPSRVEISAIDPAKLAAIRREWKNQGLLLDRDKNRVGEKEAPADARYMSDKNIRVEKEQRAKETNVIPKPGTPGANQEAQAKREAPKNSRGKSREESFSKKFPNLAKLGIPLPRAASEPAPQDPFQARSGQEGGEQAIEDKELPTGSENLLNAQESVYYSFYARLYEAIGPIWQSLVREAAYRRQPNAGAYSTIVDIEMDGEGNLIAVHQLDGSGIEEFDAAVQLAWKKVGRFPNPPHGLLDVKGEAHTGAWTFTIDVGQSLSMGYAAPERRGSAN